MKFYTLLLIIPTIFALNQEKVHSVSPIHLMNARSLAGTQATLEEIPYQAGIISTFTWGDCFCGAALIGQFWVITAAHCVHEAHHINVFLGMVDLLQYKVKVSADKIIVYPLYSADTLTHDMALVHLSKYKKPSEVKAISLNGRFLGPNVLVLATGWNKGYEKSYLSSELKNSNRKLYKFPLITTSHADCYSYFGNVVTSSVLCAYSQKPIHTTCSGDSGGPMVFINGTNQPIHAAVANFISSRGCNTTSPMVFSRTSYYKDWIRLQTGV